MEKAPINWTNFVFLTLTPIGALILVPFYGLNYGFTLFEWSCFGIYMMFTGLSITGGYHRLWAHKAYKAHFLIRFFYAIWGACSCQNSILNWASDHRSHHRFVDHRDKDPYAATRGFWFSHLFWVLRDYPRESSNFENVKDLQRDPLVSWQHRNYLTIAVITNGVIPILLGIAHGRIFGVFILAFLLRVVLNHHFTFFINSLAHYWGGRPYSDENSSRDNFMLALFTYGEGFHNFHHTFQHDYRNGIRWWHYDPSKWLIRLGSWCGMTSSLKRADKIQIEKARVRMQLKAAMAKVELGGEANQFREHIEESYHQFVHALNEWARIKKEWYQVKRANIAAHLEKVEIRNRYLALKYGLRMQRRQWQLLLADLATV